jgi:hypothetical protein
MTIRAALLLLCAGGVAAGGCGSDGGAPATCANGQPCGPDGGDGGSGDDGATAACGNVQPCGGDIVGTWMFTEDCESAASFAASAANFSAMAQQSWCPGQTLVGIEPAMDGQLVFAADGNYYLALILGGYLDIDFPASCIAGLSCDDATAGFQAQIADGSFPMPNVTSIACTGTSDCLCRAEVVRLSTEDGTYALSGSVVTFTPPSGPVHTKSYCVASGKLHILDTSMASTGHTDIESNLVAVKQ